LSRHVLYDAILGSYTARQVRNVQITSNGQVIHGLTSDGTLAELFGGRKDIRVSLDTEDVAGVIGAAADIETAGLPISAGTITIPFEKRSHLSTFASGSNHYALTGANGLVIPTSFQADGAGNASASLELITFSTNGTTAPLAEATSQALGSTAFNALYALGPVVLNGTTLTRVAGVVIRTGLVAAPEWNSAETYPREVFIRPPILPTIEIRCYDVEEITGALGGWLAGTSLVVYFRKRAAGGTFVADLTAQHLKFSFADGIVDAGLGGSGVGDDATKTYIFHGELLTAVGSQAIS
jgi:hypothetical protein